MTTRDGTAPAIHACAVILAETGVLICGAPGTGKSSLVIHLLDIGQRVGVFARLVGDDRIMLSASSGRLIARPHPAIPGLLECRWEGIVRTGYEPAAILHHVVELIPAGDDPPPRMPEAGQTRFAWGDIALPMLKLPAALGPAAQALRVWQIAVRRNSADSAKI